MSNKRSMKLMAWLLSVIMFLNMAPLTAFAANGGSASDETEGRIDVVYNVDDSITQEKTDTGIRLQLQGADLPTEVSEYKMEYTLPLDAVPAAKSGTSGNVSWTYNSSEGKLYFTWTGEAQPTFDVDVETIQLSGDEILVHHLFYNNDGSMNHQDTSVAPNQYNIQRKYNEPGYENALATKDIEGKTATFEYNNYTGTFTVKYALKGDGIYNANADIVFDQQTIDNGNPKDYENNNANGHYINEGEANKIIANLAPVGSKWDANKHELTLYYTPYTKDITVHYRRILSNGTSQDLQQVQEGTGHRITVSENGTKTNINNKVFAVAQSFDLPEDWVRVDPEYYEYEGYTIGQDVPANKIDLWPEWDYDKFIKAQNTGNSDFFLYYRTLKEDAPETTDNTGSGDNTTTETGNTNGSGEGQGQTPEDVTVQPGEEGPVTLTISRVLNPNANPYNTSDESRVLQINQFLKKTDDWNNAPYSADRTHVVTDYVGLANSAKTYTLQSNQKYGFAYNGSNFDLQKIVANNITLVSDDGKNYRFITNGTGDASITFYEVGTTIPASGGNDNDDESGISYTVTFYAEDGETELGSAVYASGTPAASVETPGVQTKASDAEYNYTFNGWNVEDVTSDVSYTASFTPELRSYEVIFQDENGVELSRATYEYGTKADDIVKPAAQTKDSTAQYDYSFDGWNVTDVEGPATYKASFTPELRSYEVIFQDENGVELSRATYEYGTKADDIVKPAAQTKDSTAQYNYSFDGWNVTDVEGPATYKASFTPEQRSYEVIFQDENGVELSRATYEYGTKADDIVKPAAQTKDSTAQYNYSFDGWNVTDVEGPATYKASFTPELRSYTITFKNEDGSELQSGDVAYGETPVYDGETPIKAADAQYTYSFKAWDKEISSVTGAETYTATYSNTVNQYRVTFVDEDEETVLLDTAYDYGTAGTDIAKPKNNPTKTGYSFTGWTTIPETITTDTVIKATYAINQYTITFDSNGGSTVAPITADYDSDVTAPSNPTRDGYTFAGWSEAVPTKMPAENKILTASWTINSYGYTIHHYLKGTSQKAAEDETGTIEYGKTVKATIATALEGLALTVDESTTARELQIGSNAANNVLTIYYTLALNVKAEKLDQVYNGQPLNGKYTITGALTADVETIKTALGTAPSIANVKESVLDYLTKTEQAQITGIPGYYVTSFTPGTLEITPAEMTGLTVTGFGEQYDGQSHGVTVSGQPDGSTVTYTYTNKDGEVVTTETTPTVKDVADGTVKVKVTVTNDNYETETRDVELKVQKRKASITVDEGQGMTYGDAPEPELTATVSGVVTLETLDYTLSREKGTDAGEYKIIVTLGENPNYDISKTDGKFTIARKKVILSAVAAEKPWGTDDPKLTAAFTGVIAGEEGDIEYVVTRDPGEYAVDNEEAAKSGDGFTYYNTFGTYVTVTNDPKNYDVTTEGNELKIVKTPVTIDSPLDKLTEGEIVYSGTVITLKAMMAGLDRFGENYAYQWQISDEKDGTYEDIAGATGRTYSYVLNNKTAGKFYRVVITLTDNVNKTTK